MTDEQFTVAVVGRTRDEALTKARIEAALYFGTEYFELTDVYACPAELGFGYEVEAVFSPSEETDTTVKKTKSKKEVT